MVNPEENTSRIYERDERGHFLRGFPHNKGVKRSDEYKKRRSEISKRYKPSEETKKKISEALKGRVFSKETREKLSKALKGKQNSLGRRVSEEMRRKQSESQKGSLAPGWKGGVSSVNEKARRGLDFNLWREAVFARDNWTCQATGVRGGKLHPHHLQNFSQYPELRFAIDNGITLSEKAHKEFHDTYGYQNNTREQMEEYLNSKNCTDEKE